MNDVLEQDARARAALRSNFDDTLFVDAGAGTGKTTAIVGRIAELVAKGHLRMAQLVAITFTEAAAAELRSRVREELEKTAADASRLDEERDRCREATATLDEASIDTIHAFAGDLLRTYPLDAGLPPDIRMLDEIEGEVGFQERFRTWFEDVGGDGHPHRETVRRALLMGFGPDRLQKLAAALHENYDLLTRNTTWGCGRMPDLVEIAHRAASDIREAQNLLTHAPAGHKCIAPVEALSFARERLTGARTVDDALPALAAIETIKVGGNGNGWPDDFRELKRLLLKSAKADAHEALDQARAAVFCALMGALRDFVLDYADERKRAGTATFQDLLCWARNLLRDSPEVRRRTQARWTRVFVDEFQDTDPLQAEIAFYLCADGVELPADWRKIGLLRGKLCLVGDPKQSIYRFRRADIALYQFVRNLVSDTLVLSRNYRSVPSVLDFVNQHFGRVMQKVAGVQPEYQELAAYAADAGPALWTIGEPLEGKQDEVWTAEADAVAGAAAAALRDGWPVRDPEMGAVRPARAGDICVLIPSRTNLRKLERAFERYDLSYRIESGEIVVGTQEVGELLACLRSIDDPSDQVALVAALRSPIYGCSDVELAQWVSEYGNLDYTYPGRGEVPRVKAAFEHLLGFHQARNRGSVAALVERFVDDRMLVAATFAERRPREAWRRYRYVASRARAFAGTGRTTLREFVEWMEGLERTRARDISGSIAEQDEDAIRVLTVHRAKGLEFPIVILTGQGSSGSHGTPTVIPDRLNDTVDAGLKDARGNAWCTPGYVDAAEAEKELEKAEDVRLRYVATTRARDHLVIGLHHKVGSLTPAAEFMETLASFGERVRPVDLQPPAALVATPRPKPSSVAEVVAAEEAWVARRQAALVAARGTEYISATARAHLAEPGEPRTEPDAARFRRGRGGTSLGRAVHAVLQAIDLESMAGLETLARAQAAAEGIPDRAGDVARLVRHACESEPVRRAVGSGRYWREVPLGAPVGEYILEGFIDLLFEGPEGLEIVDYKTDSVSPSEVEERMPRYKEQGVAYADLVRALTSRSVAQVSFVFAEPAVVVEVGGEMGGGA